MRESAPPDSMRRRARGLLDLGRPAEALLCVRRALGISPNDPELLELEGLCHLRADAPEPALLVLRRAIAASPEGPHPHYLLAFALRELGRTAEAELPLTTALRLAPDEPVYLRALAELQADLGRHAEALATVMRAVELGPDRAANHVTCGYVASRAGDKRRAREAYERAVSLEPNEATAWNNLGCLDLEGGQTLKARARFREALRLDPQATRARKNLALATPPVERRRARPRSWEGALEELARQLVWARAPWPLQFALVMEAPGAARAFVGGRSRTAAFAGAALLPALKSPRAAGAALALVGAAASLAWLTRGRQIAASRRRVREALDHGRRQFERLWSAWLDGSLTRDARDRELDELIDRMALRAAGDP